MAGQSPVFDGLWLGVTSSYNSPRLSVLSSALIKA
jgi:hypothetical protein